MDIVSRNTIAGYADPENVPVPPVLSASETPDDSKMCWISVFQNTGEIVTIEGAEYLKLVCYLSANFDVLVGYRVAYDYRVSWAAPWIEAKTDPLEVMYDFTYGTSVDDLRIPTWTSGTTVTEAHYTVKNNVYVPHGLTTCFLQAHLYEKSDEFHKDWFVYKTKGDVTAGSQIITEYRVPKSVNLITSELNPTSFNIRTETKIESDRAVTAATVQARLTKVADRPYLTGTDDTEVYQMT